MRENAYEGNAIGLEGVLLEASEAYIEINQDQQNIRLIFTSAYQNNNESLLISIWGPVTIAEGAFYGCRWVGAFEFRAPVTFLGPIFDDALEWKPFVEIREGVEQDMDNFRSAFFRTSIDLTTTAENLAKIDCPRHWTRLPYKVSKDGQWYYHQRYYDGSIAVVYGYLGNETEVVIPDSIDGLRVYWLQFGLLRERPKYRRPGGRC